MDSKRSRIPLIMLGVMTASSIACIGLVLYYGFRVGMDLHSLNISPEGDIGSLFRFLDSIQALLIASAVAILLLSITLCFTVYYFIQRQKRLVRAASIIKKSHDRYRFFTEAPPSIGIIRFDLVELKINDANRAALSLFGKSRADMVGKPIFSLLPQEEQVRMKQVVDQLMAGAASAEITVRIQDELNRERYVSWHITNLKSPDVEPEAISVVLDVTEKMQAQEERLEKERLAGVLEMAGATAHELNQPLQVISGIAWMMLSKLDKGDPNYRKVEKIYNEVERMTAIANKISSISSYKVKKYVGQTRIIDIEKAAAPDKPFRGPKKHKGGNGLG